MHLRYVWLYVCACVEWGGGGGGGGGGGCVWIVWVRLTLMPYLTFRIFEH